MKNTDLTVILTLRGRHLHTLRWMWHANRIKLPYHVIIADGDVHPTIDRLLSDPSTFPHLSFEYHRHRDRTYSDFYKKCSETIRKVRTRYVMMSDNDDFIIKLGVKHCIDQLDDKSDYACAGGQIPGFTISPDPALAEMVIGSEFAPKFGYQYRCRDISSPSTQERVMDEITNYQTIYYHIYRTPILRTIFEEVERHDFSDLTVHEYYCALRAATLGKIKSDASVICYLRQSGTSSALAQNTDWVHHLMRSKLPQDFRTLATAISREVTKDDVGLADINERILDGFASKLRHMLGHTMLRHRFPFLFLIKQKLSWIHTMRLLPGRFRRARAQRLFWHRFLKDCPEPALPSQYKTEFLDIESTLGGEAFPTFIKAHAGDLA